MGSSSSRSKEQSRNSPKRKVQNVYNDDIQICESGYGKNYSMGSMQEDGTCTEGRRCTPNMRQKHRQRKGFLGVDWTIRLVDQRGDRAHCVCLGAYANFVAKQKSNDKTIDCNATPNTVFDPKYVRHWSNWNDVTLPDQISAGVNDLYTQCREQADVRDRSESKAT